MRLIADQLNQVQNWRVPVQHNRVILLPVHVDDLLALGDRGQRLIDNPQLFQRACGGVQLPDAYVDQNEARV